MTMASCGTTTGTGDDASGASGASGPTTSAGPELRGIDAVAVTAIEVGADDRHVVLIGSPAPGPDGPARCRSTPKPGQASEAEAAYVEVYALVNTDGRAPWKGCPGLAATRYEIELRAPLAGRAIRTTTPMAVWTKHPDGAYAVCARPACDPGPADPVPTVTCDGPALADAARGADAPAHSGIGLTRCAGRFAVVELDLGAGACPVTGDAEEPNPCAGQRIQRLFLRASGEHWQVAYESNDAGCSDVRLHVTDFPDELCADLAPIAGPGRG